MDEIGQGDNAAPGGRLWLVKWLLVAALAVLVLVLLLGGGPDGA